MVYSILFAVNDFEDQLQQKNADMEQQLQLVSDLDVEIKRLQVIYRFDDKTGLQGFRPGLTQMGLYSHRR